MNISASAEWAIFQLEPIPDRLDLDYLRSIHRRFMSPVLDWAGELRKVGDEVGAGGTPFQYAPSEFYKPYLDALFGRLAEEDYLVGLPEKEFADRLADRWGTPTFCHPFRDGNTRSQSAYSTDSRHVRVTLHQATERSRHGRCPHASRGDPGPGRAALGNPRRAAGLLRVSGPRPAPAAGPARRRHPGRH
ncbi:Fic family protein [Actinomyces qiguomingii]|uniref:Fic family protein n=1 Tax=Actinomyces qiguomingii TaxID=2057800 RepID=UPI003A0FFDD3